MQWYYFVGLIALGVVVYLIVGWIGNKAVDKTENALRARRMQKQRQSPAPAQASRRLADQMTPQAAGQTRQTTVFPGTQPIVPVQGSPQPAAIPARQSAPLSQERKARFCASCGASLAEAARFCPLCGAVVENFLERNE